MSKITEELDKEIAAKEAARPYDMARSMANKLTQRNPLPRTELDDPSQDYHYGDVRDYSGPNVDRAASILQEALLSIGSSPNVTRVMSGGPNDFGNCGISICTSFESGL